jgi:hypothetical protein
VAAAELDGRLIVISAADCTVRVWGLRRRKAEGHHSHPIKLPHASPVHAAILRRREDGMDVITGCQNGDSWTWDLFTGRRLSRTSTPGSAGVGAIIALAPNHVLYGNGETLSLYEATNTAAPSLTIELGSPVQALAAYGTSTAVAATGLGLVALEIPRLPAVLVQGIRPRTHPRTDLGRQLGR